MTWAATLPRRCEAAVPTAAVSFSTASPGEPSFMEIEKNLASMQREIRDLHGVGRYADSLDVCQQALQVSRDHFGSEHPVTASLLNNIALNQKYLGKIDEAVTTFHEALEIYENVLGSTHTSCATCKINIAKLLQLQANNVPGLDRMQMLQEAKELAEEALVIKLDNLGDRNPEVGTVMFSLGAIYNDLKMHDEAIETLGEVRFVFRSVDHILSRVPPWYFTTGLLCRLFRCWKAVSVLGIRLSRPPETTSDTRTSKWSGTMRHWLNTKQLCPFATSTSGKTTRMRSPRNKI